MVSILIFAFSQGAQALDAPAAVSTPVPTLLIGPCMIHDGTSVIAARSRVVTFPDRREFTIVGHYHGTRDIVNGPIDALKRLASFRGGSAGFRSQILRILAQDPSASADARDDTLFLKDALANKSILFVAAEASAETVAMNLKSYAQVRQSFLADVARLGLHDDTSDVQAYAFGADFFLRMGDPSLFKGRIFIGVEDANLGRAYENSLRALERASSQIARATFAPQVAPVMNSFLNALPARYSDYHPEVDDAGILKEARARFTAGDNAKIEPYLRAQLAVMKAMKLRDRHDVDGLLAQKSSGVMFIGSSHLESMAHLLRERCELLARAMTTSR